MGVSRTRMVGFLAEPVFMIVCFTISFVAGSTLLMIVLVVFLLFQTP
jgi:formate hydrogenlyase subunit 4